MYEGDELAKGGWIVVELLKSDWHKHGMASMGQRRAPMRQPNPSSKSNETPLAPSHINPWSKPASSAFKQSAIPMFPKHPWIQCPSPSRRTPPKSARLGWPNELPSTLRTMTSSLDWCHATHLSGLCFSLFTPKHLRKMVAKFLASRTMLKTFVWS